MLPERFTREIRSRGRLFPLLIAALATPLFGQSLATREQVRSAFLFQIGQFVSWPDGVVPPPGVPLRFCVFNDNVLAGSLGLAVQGKRIEGRVIEVHKITSAANLGACHLAFIGLKTRKQLKDFFDCWKYPPVLLVGEDDLFVQMGGMVALTIDSGKVSFAVNLESTRQAGLSMRSQLLRFARVTSGERK